LRIVDFPVGLPPGRIVDLGVYSISLITRKDTAATQLFVLHFLPLQIFRPDGTEDVCLPAMPIPAGRRQAGYMMYPVGIPSG
jgi:hypothetical protein